MTTKTKIQIANAIAAELGGRPAMSMNELTEALAKCHGNTKAKVEREIRRVVFHQEAR